MPRGKLRAFKTLSFIKNLILLSPNDTLPNPNNEPHFHWPRFPSSKAIVFQFCIAGRAVRLNRKMASVQCFLHHHALTTAATRSSSSQRQAVTAKPNQLVCRAQKQAIQEDDGGLVSRRLALTVLIGAAAVGSKVSPADAAYGEAGIYFSFFFSFSCSSDDLGCALNQGHIWHICGYQTDW